MTRHHRIDYLEFSVTDMQAAQAFYRTAFGWEFTDYGESYAGIRGDRDGNEAGGFLLADRVVPGGPLVILFSDDLEASRQAVLDAGGRITAEPYDFPGGRRFHFSDPSGNQLAVWTETAD
jgi:uncharacterized protein